LVIVLLLMLTLAPACASGTATPKDTSTTGVLGVSFSKDIQSIFDSSCAICHQGVAAPGGLNIEAGLAYENLVNTQSTQSPLMLVAPGDSDSSYLLHKIQGTQGQVGGSGLRLPYGNSPLQQSHINLIQQWIEQGALDNYIYRPDKIGLFGGASITFPPPLYNSCSPSPDRPIDFTPVSKLVDWIEVRSYWNHTF